MVWNSEEDSTVRWDLQTRKSQFIVGNTDMKTLRGICENHFVPMFVLLQTCQESILKLRLAFVWNRLKSAFSCHFYYNFISSTSCGRDWMKEFHWFTMFRESSITAKILSYKDSREFGKYQSLKGYSEISRIFVSMKVI